MSDAQKDKRDNLAGIPVRIDERGFVYVQGVKICRLVDGETIAFLDKRRTSKGRTTEVVIQITTLQRAVKKYPGTVVPPVSKGSDNP